MTELSKTASQLLENVFFGKILGIEEMDNVMGAYSKQAQLDALHTEIVVLIKGQPRSKFNIVIPDTDINDISTLIINNAPESEVRNEWVITIDPDWTGYILDQISIDGNDKIRIKVFTV